jgi:hypothetical protein
LTSAPNTVFLRDPQHVAVADPEAEQHLVLGRASGVIALGHLLHLDRALERLVHVAEDDHQAVALHLQQEPAVPVDHRRMQLERFMDRLQEMDDAELGDAPRKTRQVRVHDRPALAEEIPDAPVDRLLVGAGPQPLLDQPLEPAFRLERARAIADRRRRRASVIAA